MNVNTVTLDVRKEVRAGIEPFSQIMETVDGLKAGQNFRLLAPFKPLAAREPVSCSSGRDQDTSQSTIDFCTCSRFSA